MSRSSRSLNRSQTSSQIGNRNMSSQNLDQTTQSKFSNAAKTMTKSPEKRRKKRAFKHMNRSKSHIDIMREKLNKAQGYHVPGPGHYKAKDTFARAKDAGKGPIGTRKRATFSRVPLSLTHRKPGPGDHKVMKQFGSDGRKFKMKVERSFDHSYYRPHHGRFSGYKY